MKTIDLIKKYRHIFKTDYTQDANCQGAWLFTEGSGESVADSSQNNNPGTFKDAGEPSWEPMAGVNAPSYAPYAVNFDGADDFISCGDAQLITGTVMSLGCWLYPKAIATNIGYPISKYSTAGGQREWLLILTGAADAYALSIAYDGTNVRFARIDGSLSVDIPDDEWSHFYWTRTGLTVKCYVNGVSQNIDTQTLLAGDAPLNTNTSLQMGDRVGGGRPFEGKETEVSVFDRVLDSTEVNDIIDNGLTGTAPANLWPVSQLKKGFISGYHCFMNAYLRAKVEGFEPLKLPDGTGF